MPCWIVKLLEKVDAQTVQFFDEKYNYTLNEISVFIFCYSSRWFTKRCSWKIGKNSFFRSFGRAITAIYEGRRCFRDARGPPALKRTPDVEASTCGGPGNFSYLFAQWQRQIQWRNPARLSWLFSSTNSNNTWRVYGEIWWARRTRNPAHAFFAPILLARAHELTKERFLQSRTRIRDSR